MSSTSSDIVGRWVLHGDPGGELTYPDVVEFLDGGLYTVDHEGFAVWGGGDWERDGDTLRVQDQRDRMVPYRTTLDGDGLALVDEAGTTVRYQRG